MYSKDGSIVRAMDKKLILFQGDSITDNYRSRNCDVALSSGYPTMIAGHIASNSNKYQFLNRGISGDRILELMARWKKDCLNLSPDILSILIGINDVWQELIDHNGVSNELFAKVYDTLISETVNTLPAIKIIIMEPFILHGYSTNDSWDYLKFEVTKHAETCRAIADKHNCLFVPLQRELDEMADKYGSAEVSIDGIHPTYLGHYTIAQQWTSCVLPKL